MADGAWTDDQDSSFQKMTCWTIPHSLSLSLSDVEDVKLLSEGTMDEHRDVSCKIHTVHCAVVLLGGDNSSPRKLDLTDTPDTRTFSGMFLNIDVFSNNISVWSGSAAAVNNLVCPSCTEAVGQERETERRPWLAFLTQLHSCRLLPSVPKARITESQSFFNETEPARQHAH